MLTLVAFCEIIISAEGKLTDDSMVGKGLGLLFSFTPSASVTIEQTQAFSFVYIAERQRACPPLPFLTNSRKGLCNG